MYDIIGTFDDSMTEFKTGLAMLERNKVLIKKK